jgi:hypothetical protein
MSTLRVVPLRAGFILISDFGESIVYPTPEGFRVSRYVRDVDGQESREYQVFGDGEEALVWAEEWL